MKAKLKITQKALVATLEKKETLSQEFRKLNKQKSADIATASRMEGDLKELEKFIEGLEEVSVSESSPAEVVLGARILLEDLETSDRREYTVMPRVLANPLIGVISTDSPLAQKMVGLKLGNTFKYKNYSGTSETYKVKKIDY